MNRYDEIIRAAESALNTSTETGLQMFSGFILGALWADKNRKDQVGTPKVFPGSYYKSNEDLNNIITESRNLKAVQSNADGSSINNPIYSEPKI